MFERKEKPLELCKTSYKLVITVAILLSPLFMLSSTNISHFRKIHMKSLLFCTWKELTTGRRAIKLGTCLSGTGFVQIKSGKDRWNRTRMCNLCRNTSAAAALHWNYISSPSWYWIWPKCAILAMAGFNHCHCLSMLILVDY